VFKKKGEVATLEKQIETDLCVYEKVLKIKAVKDGILNDTNFTADTGSSSDMVHSKKYLTDMVPNIALITARNDDLVECTEKAT
jgi:hypothetical protein